MMHVRSKMIRRMNVIDNKVHCRMILLWNVEKQNNMYNYTRNESEVQCLLIVELKVHAVMYLVVPEGDVVLEDGVPLLEDNLVPACAGLGRDELLEVSNSVVGVALDTHLFSEPVVARDLNHCCRWPAQTWGRWAINWCSQVANTSEIFPTYIFLLYLKVYQKTFCKIINIIATIALLENHKHEVMNNRLKLVTYKACF